MILACNKINKAFGTDEILSDVSFHINELEKAAIFGINGAGKSTLLKILAGKLSADSGEVLLSKGTAVGYLDQHQGLSPENSIYDEMMETKKEILDIYDKIRKTELAMKSVQGADLEALLKTYTNLNHEFELNNGYACQSEITGILKGLGFTEDEFSKKTDQLSGGQKTRIALGKLLLSSPGIILLDEPTNHLDLTSISWLETYLSNYKGAVVIVAHDRYFLDKIVSKVIELDHGQAQTFMGNYTEYAKKKEALRDALLKQYYNQQHEIQHQEEVIAKLRSFNREKSIKRAESREKLLNKIDRLDKPITKEAKMSIKLDPRIESGNDVLSIEHLSKAFGSNELFEDLNFEIKKGEKTAIIGNNGTGKTTILKIINGLLPSDAGEIKTGAKVSIGYYDQEHQVLNMEKTLFDELQDTWPNMDNTAIRNVLAAFLFTNDDVFKRIRDLSGGERGRVSLAKLMLSEANLLILDEPTNHLDITSREILEKAINQYTGTVLFVSHDRYFINKTASRILDLTGGALINYIGNYDYYLEKKDEMEAIFLNSHPKDTGSQNASTEAEQKNDWKQQKEEQARLRKKQNDLKKCEEEITELENRNHEIDNLLTKEEIYTNVPRLLELNAEKKELENRLEELMELWEAYLS